MRDNWMFLYKGTELYEGACKRVTFCKDRLCSSHLSEMRKQVLTEELCRAKRFMTEFHRNPDNDYTLTVDDLDYFFVEFEGDTDDS